MLVAERENSQYTWRKTTEWVTPSKATPKVHTLSNLFIGNPEEEPVIRKVAPKPSGLASFDKDLEKEINMTNLKDCVPKMHHTYLNIFSK